MSVRDTLTLAVAASGAVIALGSLIQATIEYVKRGKLERLQVFFDLRRRLKEPDLGRIAELIDEAKARPSDESKTAELRLVQTRLRTKRDYLGLFEEVDLAMEQGLIDPAIAHYMFGYYALHCADCDAFWTGVNRSNPYWDRFFKFCSAMEAEREKFEHRRSAAAPSSDLPPAVEEISPDSSGDTRVVVRIPPVLRPRSDGLSEVEVRGLTVGDALEYLVARFPQMRWQVFCKETDLESGEVAINRYMNVYLNDESVDVLDGVKTGVSDGSTIVLLPASSGG